MAMMMPMLMMQVKILKSKYCIQHIAIILFMKNMSFKYGNVFGQGDIHMHHV